VGKTPLYSVMEMSPRMLNIILVGRAVLVLGMWTLFYNPRVRTAADHEPASLGRAHALRRLPGMQQYPATRPWPACSWRSPHRRHRPASPQRRMAPRRRPASSRTARYGRPLRASCRRMWATRPTWRSDSARQLPPPCHGLLARMPPCCSCASSQQAVASARGLRARTAGAGVATGR
jgi:hypothetical protein